MARRKKAASDRILQLRVTLDDSSPPIWRTVLVPSAISLGQLHAVLQETMGWTFSHLHLFEVSGRHFGDPREDEDGEMRLEDERKFRLDDLVEVGQSLHYEYDFGDGWGHEVKVEATLERDNRFVYPHCVGGARACPPEDVGGVYGYEQFLEALKDPKHDQHDELVTWCGGTFDPEGFDRNAVNQALRDLK